MSSLKQLVCPVSNEKIDEHVTRLNALLVILMVIAGFLFNSVIFPVFLAADFFQVFEKTCLCKVTMHNHTRGKTTF